MNHESKKAYQQLVSLLAEQNANRFISVYIPNDFELIGPTLLIDRETGIEYLKAPGGGITPILASDGKPHINKLFREKLGVE